MVNGINFRIPCKTKTSTYNSRSINDNNLRKRKNRVSGRFVSVPSAVQISVYHLSMHP